MTNRVLIIDVDGVVANLRKIMEKISKEFFEVEFAQLNTSQEITVWKLLVSEKYIENLPLFEDINSEIIGSLREYFHHICFLTKIQRSWEEQRKKWLAKNGLGFIPVRFNYMKEIPEVLKKKQLKKNLKIHEREIEKYDVFLEEIKCHFHQDTKFFFVDDDINNLIPFLKDKSVKPILLYRIGDKRRESLNKGWIEKGHLKFSDWNHIIEFFKKEFTK